MRGTTTLALAALIASSGCDNAASRASRPGDRLYITSGLTDRVIEIDPRDGSLLDTLVLDIRRGETDEPHGIAVAPGGAHLYVTESHGNPTLWKYEMPEARLVGRLELGTYGASRVGVTPDATRAFIPDYYRSGQGKVSGLTVVELHDLTILAQPTLCPAPHDAQVDPTGARVAVACSLSDEIVLLDAESIEELGRFYVGDDPGPAGAPRYKPLNLVWAPDGERLFVTLHASGEVRVFESSGSLVGAIEVGAGPTQIATNDEGSTVVVANRRDGSLSVIDAETLSETARIPLGVAHPHGVTFDPEGSKAYVSYEGDTSGYGGVVAVDLERREVIWSTAAGVYTLGVAYYSGR